MGSKILILILLRNRQRPSAKNLASPPILMGWKQKWQLRGQNKSGSIARGLGLSIHNWGGRGHACECDVAIHPDGSVDVKMGTQDLGTGTRTVITVVAAETMGLPVEAIHLQIGDSQYPAGGRLGRIIDGWRS